MRKQYSVTEVFYSLQGEGMRAGTANVFVRFAGCNLACDVEPGPLSPGGFACDTNFSGGRLLDLPSLLTEMNQFVPPDQQKACILTGGEPLLQVDADLLSALQDDHWFVALETNGTRPLPEGVVDWVCVSPKVAEHCLKIGMAHEVKYVLAKGMALPKPRVSAPNYLVSPAVQPEGRIHPDDLLWCMNLVLNHPGWRLSVQLHKTWGIR